jgi:hypothetical protein
VVDPVLSPGALRSSQDCPRTSLHECILAVSCLCQGQALARDECVHISSLQEERVSLEEKKILLYLYVYIFICACVHVPPPPPISDNSLLLVHKIENNLTFPGSRPHKPLILCLTSPPPFPPPSIYIKDDRDEYLLILTGLHS